MKDPLVVSIVSRVGPPVSFDELESDFKNALCRSLVYQAMQKGLITVSSEFSPRHDAHIYSMRLGHNDTSTL